MPELGDFIGSLMSGFIRARRIADEQTAALAEYYKDNPLLEGLSVPRVRIPELTIDLPLLIENQVDGEAGVLNDPAVIAKESGTQLETTLAKNNITVKSELRKAFEDETKQQISLVGKGDSPISKEIVARTVQNALKASLIKTKTDLTAAQADIVAKDLRTKATAIGLSKAPVNPKIMTDITTASVKDKSSTENAVRLKITLKEEGLEWATHSSETGGVVRTLQPE